MMFKYPMAIFSAAPRLLVPSNCQTEDYITMKNTSFLASSHVYPFPRSQKPRVMSFAPMRRVRAKLSAALPEVRVARELRLLQLDKHWD
jgi:hypothetical protein